MKTLHKSSLLLGLLLGAGISNAHAAGMQITPTGLNLPAKQRAGVFTLSNTGKAPLTAQVRVYRWTQDAAGKDVLEPTRDLLASPPMVKLASGAQQQFRVVRAKTAPNGAPEEAYRLVVDELPAPDEKPKSGLNFVLRYSVPVFLNQTDSPEAKLDWHAASAPGGKTVLSVRNTGGAYAQLSGLTVKSGRNEKALIGGLAGYVLPGSRVQYTLDTAPASLEKGRFSVRVNGRTLAPEVRFDAP